MALLYKDGVLIHNTIDNDGVSDQASLGARYAKGRIDSTANDLDLNYFTKEEVYDLLDGIAKTYIVSQPPTTPFFLLSEDATAVSTKEYWTVTFVQDTDPQTSEMMFLYERKAFIPSWDTEPHIYYELADPTSWDPGTKTYYKVDTETQRTFTPGEAIQEVVYTKEPRYPEPNTYYLVGNDTDGYILYYFDSELEEAVIGSYTLDLSDYQKKFEYDPSLIGGLSDESTFSDVNLNATPTPLITRIKAWVVWNYIKSKATGAVSSVLESNLTQAKALIADDYGKIATSVTTRAELARLKGVTSNVQEQINNIWKTIYPVGSIYISINGSFNPNNTFGGTWERIQDRFLLATGSTYNVINSTGGSSSNTLTRANLPKVSITTSSNGERKMDDFSGVKGFAYQGGGVDNKWGLDYGRKELYEKSSLSTKLETASNHTHSFNLNGNVTQTSFTNMPPYITVNVWKRTA